MPTRSARSSSRYGHASGPSAAVSYRTLNVIARVRSAPADDPGTGPAGAIVGAGADRYAAPSPSAAAGPATDGADANPISTVLALPLVCDDATAGGVTVAVVAAPVPK